ncbi:MAG: glycosyltransferase family 4 protein [Candidatus Aminicenantes bacterium]|nr:glycosyltransferase family 4 protein [Candidatus Aminicenantes bacterium]
MEKARVALVHDWLTGQRGGEKVLEVLAEIFPQATIFTLFHFRGSQVESLEKRTIKTSFLQKLPFLKKRYRFYLPLFPMAVELFDLSGYDLVISSSHCVAKGAIPHSDALHISYVHSPVRYAWNQYFPYFSAERLSFFSRLIIPPVIHWLRVWDASSSSRVDHFLANSANVARRIAKYYRRHADVIHPPADTDFFYPAEGSPSRDYYLIVSALVPYKRIDLAVDVFNRNGKPLKIVGVGPDLSRLRRKARQNVEFLGQVLAPELRSLYQQAKGLILPGEEDFGIAAVEAQACGTPVLAYGRGGATESVVAGQTGLFFPELSPASLQRALDKFKGLAFNKSTLRSNAMAFSRQVFKEKLTSYFQRRWTEFKGEA